MLRVEDAVPLLRKAPWKKSVSSVVASALDLLFSGKDKR